MSRIHLTEEEVYDIFRNVFHNEEDALPRLLVNLLIGSNKGIRENKSLPH